MHHTYRFSKFHWLALGTGLALMATPFSATAQTFTPYQCAQCETFTEVSWSYRARGEKVQANWAIPYARSSMQEAGANYINRMQTTRKLIANSRVKEIGILNSFLDLEFFADSFLFGAEGYLDDLITGQYLNGYGWSVSSPLTSQSAGPVLLEFLANDAINYDGFDFTRAKVCCHPAGTSAPRFTVGPMERVDGFLLGTSDVVFLNIPGTSSGVHMTVTMWRPDVTGNDFDMYLKCGSDPGPVYPQFDYAATGPELAKIIHVPNGYCPSGWRLAIHAAAFAAGTPRPGYFSLYITNHFALRHYDDFRVGFSYNINILNWQDHYALVKNAVKRLFGSTEGAVYVEDLTLFENVQCLTPANQRLACNNTSVGLRIPWTCDCTKSGEGTRACDVCIHGIQPSYSTEPGDAYRCLSGSNTAFSCNVFYLPYTERDYLERVLLHELGHSKFCQPDEYVRSGWDWHCGHSIMGMNEMIFVNNFCFDEGDDYVCNHRYDGITPQPMSDNRVCYQTTPGGWDTAVSLGVVPSTYYPSEDPDHYDFVTPDFGALPVTLDDSRVNKIW